MPFSITQKDILTVCRATYYSRGRKYQQQGRVESIKWDDEEQILVAEVAGSGRRLYQQEITFPPQSGHNPFAGDCSCPVAYNF
jgi:uncharacterized Zn finger protein